MTLVAVILDVFLQAATIFAFLAVIGAIVWLLTEKTTVGIRVMTWIENMGLPKDVKEDPYNGFRIHPNNYVKSR
jgi:arginine exporter protein ArgO